VENERLRAQRRLRGWSQEDVARGLVGVGIEIGEKQLGVTRHLVSRWERGVTSPRSPYPKVLCLLFETTAEELGLVPPFRQAPASVTMEATAIEHGDDVERRDLLGLFSSGPEPWPCGGPELTAARGGTPERAPPSHRRTTGYSTPQRTPRAFLDQPPAKPVQRLGCQPGGERGDRDGLGGSFQVMHHKEHLAWEPLVIAIALPFTAYNGLGKALSGASLCICEGKREPRGVLLNSFGELVRGLEVA